MARQSAQARRHLDTRLHDLRRVVAEPRPHRGWIRAIRDALGMSTTELGARLGISQPSVVALEHSEVNDTIKLETLRRVAAAMDCELAYFLIPRTTLEQAVRRRAESKAARHLQAIAHQGRLEAQELSPTEAATQLAGLSERLVDRRGLWSEDTE